MNIPPSTNRNPDTSPRPSTLSHPLFWVVLAMMILVGVSLFRGTSRTGKQEERAGAGSAHPGSAALRNAPHQPSTITTTRTLSLVELREAAILSAVGKTVELNYQDRPLEDVIVDLGRQLDIPVWIDRQSLTDEGVALDQPVTLCLPRITGRSALQLILSPVQLDWIVDNEVLGITTASKAGEFLETRAYDVTDLVEVRDQAGAIGANFTELLDLLSTTISPDSWESLNGPGNAQEFSSGGIEAITVRQTQRVHAEIVAFLANLRSQRRSGAATIRAVLPVRNREPKPHRPEATAEQFFINPRNESFVRGNNQFAFELYARLARDRTGNVLVSPYCISNAMAMIYSGARGETAREIADTMHFLLRPKDLATAVSEMQLTSCIPQDCLLGTANKMWGRNGIEFLEPFRETLPFRFSGGFEQIDFSETSKAVKAINTWTSGATKGLVSDVISDQDLSDQTRFVMTSAVYFNGKWSVPFRRELTMPEAFSTDSGDVTVPMMHLDKGSCSYTAIDGLQILDKTYGSGEFSMVILLPAKERGSLSELEGALTGANLEKWLGALNPEKVQIHIPRFLLETGCELGNVLKSLGMKQAFETANADFSGMCETERLALGKVLHKVYVSVDELGTRAAAAMAATMYMGGAPGEPQVFRADHPFVFLIRDNRTGAILFIGRVVNPKEAQSRG